ncbi:MAG TPA: hypothetical protein VHZ74_21515, partial [Bryobacteraceae bacterium]|nr:hypothetical protein [Bryobacteraceae bacterium]
EPGASYRFSAWVHTETLTTDQGVRFRLEWTENAHNASVETGDVHGTQPWTEVSIPWTATGDAARQVRVCISRKPGDDFGSRIHGTAWIDDVALTPALNAPLGAPASIAPASTATPAPASPRSTTQPTSSTQPASNAQPTTAPASKPTAPAKDPLAPNSPPKNPTPTSKSPPPSPGPAT